jgi:outer membrane receptor for ferrienterochelin and colicins
VAQRFIGRGFQLHASAFDNHLSALVNQRVDTLDNNRLVFENADEIRSRGIELGLMMNRGRGLTGHATYALQRTTDAVTGAVLTNSPRHAAQLQLRAPLWRDGLTASAEGQYMSSRRTLAGSRVDGFAIANVSLLAARVFRRLELSATVYNVFGTRYGVPGSEEHAQDILQQDGRTFRVKTTLHF